ncbi:hypothetical protein CDL12_26738 [Handroanthus impetiginosus]|uniref:Uncharacterized protein n=1 Tax=Handroanthus impetiginosus TaxID=429701 RepID=A0A2G9G617_9LAMI|nr:hypothetical protein CDL12_26738 [Handroanthus impetiginosus]
MSYAPASLAEKAGGMYLSKYDVPNITSLLLMGPKGSGKSSLVKQDFSAACLRTTYLHQEEPKFHVNIFPVTYVQKLL